MESTESLILYLTPRLRNGKNLKLNMLPFSFCNNVGYNIDNLEIEFDVDIDSREIIETNQGQYSTIKQDRKDRLLKRDPYETDFNKKHKVTLASEITSYNISTMNPGRCALIREYFYVLPYSGAENILIDYFTLNIKYAFRNKKEENKNYKFDIAALSISTMKELAAYIDKGAPLPNIFEGRKNIYAIEPSILYGDATSTAPFFNEEATKFYKITFKKNKKRETIIKVFEYQ
ncbi:MAG: hypothetical protein LUH22_08660 [Bacteroides sp.]|nr:hypothetical protein [Bacteroides sp.]